MKVYTPIGVVVEVTKEHYEANKNFLTPYEKEVKTTDIEEKEVKSTVMKKSKK